MLRDKIRATDLTVTTSHTVDWVIGTGIVPMRVGEMFVAYLILPSTSRTSELYVLGDSPRTQRRLLWRTDRVSQLSSQVITLGAISEQKNYITLGAF